MYRAPDAAQKSLFALAQSSEEGYKSACGLIAKIYKKEASGQEIKNPSAFIHRSCMQTWNALGWGHTCAKNVHEIIKYTAQS